MYGPPLGHCSQSSSSTPQCRRTPRVCHRTGCSSDASTGKIERNRWVNLHRAPTEEGSQSDIPRQSDYRIIHTLTSTRDDLRSCDFRWDGSSFWFGMVCSSNRSCSRSRFVVEELGGSPFPTNLQFSIEATGNLRHTFVVQDFPNQME